MSGIEIIGLAASVIQIAESGLKLSVRLYTFTRKIRRADKDIDALSHEIATTGAILQQLGEAFNDEKSGRLCSPEAISTVKQLIDDCGNVFQKLEKTIDTSEANAKGKVSLRLRLNFTFLESHIADLRANLERLKSSLLVILNVLILAEQVRNKEALPILQDQKSLLQTLIQESIANQKRYDEVLKRIEANAENNDALPSYTLMNFAVASNLTVSGNTTVKGLPQNDLQPDQTHDTDLPLALKHHHKKIVDHGSLVTNLLQEVASKRYKLDHVHRMGLHDGILDIHWNAWSGMRKTYGHEVFLKMFSNFEDVSGHWIDRSIADPPALPTTNQADSNSTAEERKTSPDPNAQNSKVEEERLKEESDEDMGFGLFDDIPPAATPNPEHKTNSVVELTSEQTASSQVHISEENQDPKVAEEKPKDVELQSADGKWRGHGRKKVSTACSNCLHRRIKCIPSVDADSTKCKNCVSLKKDCHFGRDPRHKSQAKGTISKLRTSIKDYEQVNPSAVTDFSAKAWYPKSMEQVDDASKDTGAFAEADEDLSKLNNGAELQETNNKAGNSKRPMKGFRQRVSLPISEWISFSEIPMSDFQPPGDSSKLQDINSNMEKPEPPMKVFRQHRPGPRSGSVFSSAMPMSDFQLPEDSSELEVRSDGDVLFEVMSEYDFHMDNTRHEKGFPYLIYEKGERFNVIGERGELWLAINQNDPTSKIGWIWNKHFIKVPAGRDHTSKHATTVSSKLADTDEIEATTGDAKRNDATLLPRSPSLSARRIPERFSADDDSDYIANPSFERDAASTTIDYDEFSRMLMQETPSSKSNEDDSRPTTEDKHGIPSATEPASANPIADEEATQPFIGYKYTKFSAFDNPYNPTTNDNASGSKRPGSSEEMAHSENADDQDKENVNVQSRNSDESPTATAARTKPHDRSRSRSRGRGSRSHSALGLNYMSHEERRERERQRDEDLERLRELERKMDLPRGSDRRPNLLPSQEYERQRDLQHANEPAVRLDSPGRNPTNHNSVPTSLSHDEQLEALSLYSYGGGSTRRTRSRSSDEELNTNRHKNIGSSVWQLGATKRDAGAAQAGAVGAASAARMERTRVESRECSRSRSRPRSRSRRRLPEPPIGLGLAALADLDEKIKAESRERSRSRPRPRSRSRSRPPKLPISAAGLGMAALAGLYEKIKAEQLLRDYSTLDTDEIEVVVGLQEE